MHAQANEERDRGCRATPTAPVLGGRPLCPLTAACTWDESVLTNALGAGEGGCYGVDVMYRTEETNKNTCGVFVRRCGCVAPIRVTHDVMNTTRENNITATRPSGSTMCWRALPISWLGTSWGRRVAARERQWGAKLIDEVGRRADLLFLQ